MMHGELYRERRREFTEAWRRLGHNGAAVAREFRVTHQTAINAARKLGLVVNSRGNPKTTAQAKTAHMLAQSRTKKIIKMREGFKSYEDIGQSFGITRERVRQILKVAGREDLLGSKYYWSAHRSAPPAPRDCQSCEQPFTPAGYNHEARFCSPKCRGAGLKMRPDTVKRARRALKRRRGGVTWKEIGEEFGQSWHGPYSAVQRYAAETGIDVSAAFPGKGHYRRKPNGK